SFAQREFSRAGLEYRVADHARLENYEGAFDVVVSSHVLEHIADPGKALSILLPLGEWFIIEVPLERCWLQSFIWTMRFRKQEDNPLGHVNFWTRRDFLRFLRKNGLLVIQEYQYASAPFSSYNSSFKRLLERALLKVLGVCGYGVLMATHFVVLARKFQAPQTSPQPDQTDLERASNPDNS
ncbi:MAG: methyltransferase domain-containing protein, partial [Burkholderiales bacterium]|nr:methyltransferase domain-containing protein [Burkholderiales bacterium]